MGLSRTFQNLQVFFRMTALENVMAGRHLQDARPVRRPVPPAGQPPRQCRDARRRDGAARRGRAGRQGGAAGRVAALWALKRLEIARALATDPRVLLLDEPAAGCNPVETEEIDHLIAQVAARGVAVVLIEHDMKLVMRISRRIVVLNQGRMLAEGTPEEVRRNPEVVAPTSAPRA
jgi:branched-chain amino acid transport system ATP-binding protein